MRPARLIVAVAGAVLAGCVAQPKPAPGPVYRSEPVTLTSAQVAAIESGVKAKLKDPNSAMFGRMAGALNPDDGLIYVCGYVNSRNSFGGYVGDTLFYGAMTTSPLYFAALHFGGNTDDHEIAVTLCTRHGVPL